MQSNKTSSVFRIQTALLCLSACAALWALLPTGATAQETEPKQFNPPVAPVADSQVAEDRQIPVKILYRGQLQDGEGLAISGVFPLRFKLYEHHMATEASWQEDHFIAVVDGRYNIELGLRETLTPTLLEGDRWMGVELAEEGEILRDRLIISLVDPTQPGGVRTLRPTTAGAAANSTFAEVAERANFADQAAKAEQAEKIGSLDAEAIEKLSNLALERLGEHILDPDAHQGGGGKRGVSTERRTMDSVGGRGGEPYDVRCPPGFVVTGIEGRAGRVLDSLRIVCSPIQ